jgi:hypothetical protein
MNKTAINYYTSAGIIKETKCERKERKRPRNLLVMVKAVGYG